MKMRRNGHGPLFNWACQMLKHFLLFVAGFTIFCILSFVFGLSGLLLLIIPALGPFILRLAAFVTILMITSIVLESIQS